jgi:hypothetical protein
MYGLTTGGHFYFILDVPGGCEVRREFAEGSREYPSEHVYSGTYASCVEYIKKVKAENWEHDMDI